MSFDRNNAADLAALQDEVANDPRNVGFASANGATQVTLDLLNTVSSNPSSDQVNVPFDDFAAIDSIDEIVNSEYVGLNALKKTRIDAMIQAFLADPLCTFGPYKKLFKSAFGSESTTWGNVKDDRARDASIAESLFGRDTIITRADWFAARDYEA